LLKWIKTNFPEIPIILLLRQPCAVAASKLKLGWGAHLEEFLAQDELMEDFLSPLRSEMENVQSPFDGYILMWCIENYVPLKQFKTGEIHLAFYENFCVKPDQEVDRLFSFLGETYDAGVFKAMRRPSALFRKESAIYSGENLIQAWKKHVTDKQIQRAVEILCLFGLQKIYSENPMPSSRVTKILSLYNNFGMDRLCCFNQICTRCRRDLKRECTDGPESESRQP
jgi:sulfotransferase family protein